MKEISLQETQLSPKQGEGECQSPKDNRVCHLITFTPRGVGSQSTWQEGGEHRPGAKLMNVAAFCDSHLGRGKGKCVRTDRCPEAALSAQTEKHSWDG